MSQHLASSRRNAHVPPCRLDEPIDCQKDIPKRPYQELIDEYHDMYANHTSKADCPACCSQGRAVLPEDRSVQHYEAFGGEGEHLRESDSSFASGEVAWAEQDKGCYRRGGWGDPEVEYVIAEDYARRTAVDLWCESPPLSTSLTRYLCMSAQHNLTFSLNALQFIRVRSSRPTTSGGTTSLCPCRKTTGS